MMMERVKNDVKIINRQDEREIGAKEKTNDEQIE